MLKVNKSHPAYKEIEVLAKQKMMTVKGFMLDDNNNDLLADIFYKHMPKATKIMISRERVKKIFSENKSIVMEQLQLD